jgi:D-alanyl-D-alanine carboxypeptidase
MKFLVARDLKKVLGFNAFFILKMIFIILSVMSVTACGNKTEQSKGAPEQTVGKLATPKNGFDVNELENILDRYTTEKGFMGSVAISKSGQVIFSQASGYSDYENKILATPATKYRIGSVTKTFTALLALKAVEEQKLSLNDTLDKHYPAIDGAEKITITHLLNHRSGLPSFTQDRDFMDYVYKGITREALLNKFYDYELEFSPGTKLSYSNTAYYLMSLILENIYQKPYEELVQVKLAVPLGLANTYYGKTVSAINGEAYSYGAQNEEDGIVNQAQDFDHSTMLGAGGIISTPKDLLTLYDALFAGKVLQQETLASMLNIEQRFGLGLEKITYTGRESYGHRGRVAEYNAIALHQPEEEITIAIVDNSSFSDIPSMTKDILSAYFKEEIVSISSEALEKFVGSYQDVNNPSSLAVFERKGDKLIHVINGEFRSELIFKGENDFVLDQSYAPAITFSFSDDGQRMIFKQQGNSFDHVKKK